MDSKKYVVLNGIIDENGRELFAVVGYASSLKEAKEIAKPIIAQDKCIKSGGFKGLITRDNYTYVTAIRLNGDYTFNYKFYKEVK